MVLETKARKFVNFHHYFAITYTVSSYKSIRFPTTSHNAVETPHSTVRIHENPDKNNSYHVRGNPPPSTIGQLLGYGENEISSADCVATLVFQILSSGSRKMSYKNTTLHNISYAQLCHLVRELVNQLVHNSTGV